MDPISAPLEAVDAVDVRTGSDRRRGGRLRLDRPPRRDLRVPGPNHAGPGVAEDLLQEAFLRLTREVRADRTPDNVRAWLYRVGANLAVSRGRRITSAFHGIVRLATSPGSDRTEDAPEVGYLAA